MSKRIPLSKGYFAIVDAEDYEGLIKHRWWVCGTIGNMYALRTKQKDKIITRIRMHRVVMNAPKNLEVDHINGNTLDNRKNNLRLCTKSENNRNTKKHEISSSKYKGVHWSPYHERWKVMIYKNKAIYIGVYRDEKEAALAYNNMAKKLFGTFAKLNHF